MKKKLMIALLALLSFQARADEGMWLPSLIGDRIADMQANGFKLSAEDVYSINQASLKDGIVQFGRGCSGELISPDGLLITNHHCGFGQIQAHSSVEHDYLTNGFWAMNRDEELPNEGLTVKFLIRMDDVTDIVLKGYKEGMSEEKRMELVKKNSEKLAKKTEKEGLCYRVSIESMYYGNQYFMFVYQEFSDVRLVGAPPASIGKFGGDTDNWTWPRHTGDFSLFRIYADRNNNPAEYSEDNVPYHPRKFFNISAKGLNEGDFTMVYGFPGSTKEYILSEEVDYVANLSNPHKIALRTIVLDQQKAEMDKSAEVRIKYASKQARVANAWKKWQGEMKGIIRLKTVEEKKAYEAAFSKWAEGNAKYEGLVERMTEIYDSVRAYDFTMDYFNEAIWANELVRFAYQYADSEVGEEGRAAMAKAFYKDYYRPIDQKTFAALMEQYDKNVSADFKPEYFKNLVLSYKGDYKAMSDDMFEKTVFSSAEKLAGAQRDQIENDVFVVFTGEMRKFMIEKVNPVRDVLKRELNLCYRDYMKGQMEFSSDKAFYPDANLTLRIAYGKVAGYSPKDGVYYTPVSTLEGIMQKDNPDIYDYNIPQSLRDAYAAKDFGRWEVNGTIPVAFIGTNHTTGGNSGSPVLNAEGDLVGVNFDRVWEGTMSDIVFDPDYCRNIALDIRYALFIIDKVGGASHLIDEMVIKK